MRTYVPPGYGLLEVVFELIGMPRKMSCTIGMNLTAPPTPAMLNSLYTAWGTQWRPRLPTSYRFASARLYVGDGTHTPPYLEQVTAVAGTNANLLLYPPSVVHVVNKVTALGGRKGKGRMYIPGAKEGDADNFGIIAPATLATYNTSLANLKAVMEATAGVGDLYLLGHSASNPPVRITALTMRAKLGSQVNRLRDPL